MKRDLSSNGFQDLEIIRLSLITLDEEVQPRCQVHSHVVEEYAEAMCQGDKFPPVIVFYNGSKRWLVDGFHRFHAKKAIGELEILADVWQGNQQDAVLYAMEASTESELKLTQADLDRNVFKLIGHPVWQKWSDEEIAIHCGTHANHVHMSREQRVTDLYNMVVAMNKIGKPQSNVKPLVAKNFDLVSALNMDSTTFGPLISDYFLRIWVDMLIDNRINQQSSVN
ncbi:ParB/Srx family N-terminal domain-containing protein [Acaryochloris marina]|uniref:ParB/Srx family N-terminal domain-containing protein n=1 Tax=Acaryochloris marina TaxID=155978 RepID=UPI001BB0C7C5|nr:ParB/Srx family N-terminal domain-containing protein [Acaryochloris marina]QUY45958.1 hypothetical protein I1H34_29965 [Acaryochloris marina S15]